MRYLILIAAALAAVWFGFVDNGWMDRRPSQRILFIGHSLTYYNDMPAMVAKMAASADFPVRYDITMSAFPNADLEDHWNDRKTRQLLAKGGWDRIVAQPRRSAVREPRNGTLYISARNSLVGTAEQPPAIVISHLPDDDFYREQGRTTPRSDHFDILQENLRGLAIATGADVIDVARVWDKVRGQGLPFSLYKDGNHPSLEGSYLAALVVYAGLSHGSVADVTYVPWGMSNADARLLRERVQAALQ